MRQGWHVVPEGESLTDQRRQFAADLGLDADWQWAKMCDYEFPRPHHDVDKTWRNWCRTAYERGEARQKAGAVDTRFLEGLQKLRKV